jgi:hypothetical protein
MNALPTINDWRVIARGGPYAAPEIHGFGIVGRVSGHPNRAKFPDGEAITTSRLVASRGRVVTTESGSRYRLGTPNAEWEAWCVAEGKPLDPKHPVRIHSRRKRSSK